MLLSSRSPYSRKRKGQVVIFVAFSMVAIMGFLALSLDGGAMLSERRHAQATADAAALAAAGELYRYYYVNAGLDGNGNAKAAALAAASRNGYKNDGTTVVTVNIPPLSGEYVGKPGYAEVIVQYNHPRGFSSLFGSGDIPVIARAVAVGIPRQADVGVLVLNPADKDSLNANGNGTLTVEGTPVIVDSSHSQAAIASGGAKLIAPEFDIVGNYSTSGGGSFTGTINTGRSYTEDPLKYLPAPDPTSLTVQSSKKVQYTDETIYTLSAGVYKGGINVSGKASLVLLPGIYYMDGGGFSFSGQGSLTAAGVLIYNAPGNGNADKIDISGQGAIVLTPMTSGIYQGMALWQDRNSTVSAQVTGNGTSLIEGTFYFASAELKVAGNGDVKNLGSQYISDKLTITGNGNMKITWDPGKVARRRMIALVE